MTKFEGLSSFKKSEDAVSPVIAMVLILFIVTTSIGIVYITGLPRIESAKDKAHMENMKSAFIVLQGDIKEVVQAPATVGQGRVTKLSMEKGSLYVFPSSVENGTGYIEYTGGDQKIIYENGAVFIKYPSRDSSIIVSDPMMYVIVDEDEITHVHIHSIMINGTDAGGSVGGSGDAQILLKRGNVSDAGGMAMDEITIKVEDSVAFRGWYSFFEDMLKKSDLESDEYDVANDSGTKTTTVKITGKDDTSGVHDIIVYYKETGVIASV